MPLEVNIPPVEKHCTKSYVALLRDKIFKTEDEALRDAISNEHKYQSTATHFTRLNHQSTLC